MDPVEVGIVRQLLNFLISMIPQTKKGIALTVGIVVVAVAGFTFMPDSVKSKLEEAGSSVVSIFTGVTLSPVQNVPPAPAVGTSPSN